MLALALAAALDPSLADLRRTLETGNWNQRIHAVHTIGEMKVQPVELLAYAADDADWQVRLTAVHFLGRAGAAPELARLVKTEPCRQVRISTIHWLGNLGDTTALSAALDDESDMMRVQSRYWLQKQGKAPRASTDERAGEEQRAKREALNVCAAAPLGGRLERPAEAEPEPEAQPDPLPASIASAAPMEAFPPPPAAPREKTAAEKRQEEELDDLIAPGKRAMPAGGEAKEHATSRAGAPSGKPKGTLPGEADTMPKGLSLAARPESERPSPYLEGDAGTKRELDPIPLLIERLRSPEARARARAADELSRRGPAAAPAVGPLRRNLGDADRRARASAALALGNVGRDAEPAVPDLVRLLRDQSEDVRSSAALALARLDTPAAKKALRRYVAPPHSAKR